MEREMFYGAKPIIFERAKMLRENMTLAEQKLWDYLKENQLEGHRFKPQHSIDKYIADFYCHKLKLVIEIDGEIHKYNKEYDDARTEDFESLGLKVLRFRNEEVLNDIESVLLKIKKY